jgi:hypothetical protein
MRSSHNNTQQLVEVLSILNPDNVIPSLEQSIEIERLKMDLDPSAVDKVRDLMFLLNFFRFKRLGG